MNKNKKEKEKASSSWENKQGERLGMKTLAHDRFDCFFFLLAPIYSWLDTFQHDKTLHLKMIMNQLS